MWSMLLLFVLLWALPVHALTPAEADADFAARCAAPGVLVCRGFDTEAALKRGVELQVGSVPSAQNLDTQVYASGGGSLRLTIPSQSSQTFSGGYYLSHTPLEPGGDIYYQWAQRFDAGMLQDWEAILAQGPTKTHSTWKQLIIEGDCMFPLTPCPAYLPKTRFSGFVVTRGLDLAGVPHGYTYISGQEEQLATSLNGTYPPNSQQRFLVQNGDYACAWPTLVTDQSKCLRYTPDVWWTWQVHIHLGAIGKPETVYQLWAAPEGQPLKLYLDIHGLTSRQPFLNTLTLTAYMTRKDPAVAHAPGQTWYDELIASSKPIAAPARNPGSPVLPDPGPPALPPPVVTPPPPGKPRLVTGPPIPAEPGWYELAHTTLRQVDPCPQRNCPYSGNSGQTAVVTDWNSGAFDTQRNRLLLWGGGHAGYFGNEVYAVNLDSLTVERLTEPGVPLNECQDAIANGTQPASRHTYDGLVYMANVDQLLTVGGIVSCRSGTYANAMPWVLDLAQRQWRKLVPTVQPADVSVQWELGNTGHFVAAAYDPGSGLVYLTDYRCLFHYDPSTNVLKGLSPRSACKSNLFTRQDSASTAIVDPGRRQLLLFGGGDQWRVDLSPGSTYVPQPLTTTGGGAIVNAYYPGLAYDPVAQRVVAWAGGETVYSLDTQRGQWTAQTYLGGPGAGTLAPGQTYSTGLYKRWAYSPQLDVFVVVTDVDKNAFALRLPRQTPGRVQGQLTFTHTHE